MYPEGLRHLPNLICAFRLILVPLCVRGIVDGQYIFALVCFSFAGISDFVDGYLCRRFSWQSKLGAMLDPLADKALMAGTYLTLGYVGDVPVWLVAVIFGRDLAILLGAAVISRRVKVREFPPLYSGKVSTTIQICTAVAVLAWRGGMVPYFFPALGFVLTLVATLYSGYEYLQRGRSMLAT